MTSTIDKAEGGLRKRLRRFFGKKEEGNSTIEFVLIFPIFMTLFIASFESGMVMIRQTMLDRGTDIAVRAMRLGIWDDPSHDELKVHICNFAGILPDCLNNMRIELRPVSNAFTPLGSNPNCVDKSLPIQPPVEQPDYGVQNEMMLVRVCAMMKPMIITASLGRILPMAGQDGFYRLTSTSAFVNEPRS